jgi:uncharacterized protein (TIGR02145 family)
MRKKVILWMLTLIMMSVASVNAQVIIGGNGTDDPHAGAVLDLSKASGNSVGFLLPRVSLKNVNTWQIGGIANQGEGMAIYNTNKDVVGGSGSGIYIWNGRAWTRIRTDADDACPRIVKDSEKNAYLTGWFGDAGCWMTENLRSTAGLTATSNAGSDTSSKYYWYPYSSQMIFDSNLTYGLLYTWAAATGRTGVTDNEENKSDQDQHQGICPSGWHLPSDYEWNQLEQVIAESAQGVYSTTAAITWDISAIATGWRGTHGQKMKSTTPVDDQATDGMSKLRTENGFDALLVGNMSGGSPASYGTGTYFWSSSSASSTSAWRRSLASIGVYRISNSKSYLLSVRCKKNE